MTVSFLNFLSGLFGWVYFFAWSASFYPQPLLNWRRRSTTGTTVDFPLINVLGESQPDPIYTDPLAQDIHDTCYGCQLDIHPQPALLLSSWCPGPDNYHFYQYMFPGIVLLC